MKRLFVGAALLPLVYAAAARAETKISTATTAPVATSTVAAGQPDSLLIEAAGSITLAGPGAAVTRTTCARWSASSSETEPASRMLSLFQD